MAPPTQTTSKSPFYIPPDLSHTALLLADCQTQIASRLPADALATFTFNVHTLLSLFRSEIASRRANLSSTTPSPSDPYTGVPLVIHHVFPAGINSNAFISPYNKLSVFFKYIQKSGTSAWAPPNSSADPNHPVYAILPTLKPENDT